MIESSEFRQERVRKLARGFTGAAIFALLLNVGIIGGLVWTAVHFIRKWW